MLALQCRATFKKRSLFCRAKCWDNLKENWMIDVDLKDHTQQETLFIKSIPTSPSSTSTSSSSASVISSKGRMNHQSSSSTTIVTNFKQTLIDSILVLEYNELNIEYWRLWIRQWWKNYSETEIDATKQESSPRTWEQMQRLHTEEPWIKRKR